MAPSIGALQRALRQVMAARTPLIGAPEYARPNARLRMIADAYADSMGLRDELPTHWAAADPERGGRIAQAYDAMVNDPSDPLVAASWRRLGDETLDQLDTLLDRGYKFEFMPKGENPYADSPHRALDDLRDNQHLYVFPSEDGFGSINAAVLNPLMEPVRGFGRRAFGGAPFVKNDAFRAVHDAFGHAPTGAGFRAGGEENAFRHHRAMFSDMALPAMTTETRGQSSWVNYGPFAERNKGASQADTIYADQKVGLLPEEVYNEGVSGRQISIEELRRRLAALLMVILGGGAAAEVDGDA